MPHVKPARGKSSQLNGEKQICGAVGEGMQNGIILHASPPARGVVRRGTVLPSILPTVAPDELLVKVWLVRLA